MKYGSLKGFSQSSLFYYGSNALGAYFSWDNLSGNPGGGFYGWNVGLNAGSIALRV